MNLYSLEEQEELIEFGNIDEIDSAFMQGYLAAVA
jgi:hypothetical protein|tara:strand:- start:2868 stop:2972 length:105 start_codon:yes stop_codon:yes gene_type:complete